MNVRTALISSALLLAVLGWACEQGPSALGTPGGAILEVKKDCEASPDDPRCEPKDGGGKTKYEAIITIGDSEFSQPTRTVTTVTTFPVDNKCNSGNSIPMNSITKNGTVLDPGGA